MHPSRDVLRQYINDKLDMSLAQHVQEHLKQCQFCKEFVDSQRLFSEYVTQAEKEAMPQKAQELADRLYEEALAGRMVSLKLLLPKDKPLLRLAADGDKEFRPRVEHLATLCSESPEIVLRVMRDLDQGRDFLQLITDDPALSAHVMVRVPELEREFITDDSGCVMLEGGSFNDPEKLTWQIKIPQAVFSLQPLVYDPDRTEYANDVLLETKRNDKIKVTFEGKTEGKQISIRILELDGKTDFGPVKVSVTQHNASVIKDARRNELLSFDLVDANDEINIRLFQSF